MPQTLIETDLKQFTGTELWYRHSFVRDVLYTDGARHVAEAGGAYWLLDEIAMAQMQKELAAEPFQVWKLAVCAEDSSATLTCEDGNGNEVSRKAIPFTDFPLKEVTLWFADNVILLPSEY